MWKKNRIKSSNKYKVRREEGKPASVFVVWFWVSDSARGHGRGRSRALLVSQTQSALWEGLLYLFQHILQQWRLITFSVNGDCLISLGPRESTLDHVHMYRNISENVFYSLCFGWSACCHSLCREENEFSKTFTSPCEPVLVHCGIMGHECVFKCTLKQ